MKKNKPSERKFKKPYGLADKLLKLLPEDPSTALLREDLKKFIPDRDASSWWWWQKHPDLLVRRITKLKKELGPGWKKGKTPEEKTVYAIQRWLNLALWVRPALDKKEDPNKKAEPLIPNQAEIRGFMARLQFREGLKYNKGPTYLAISIFKFRTGIADEKLETILQFFNRAKQKYRDVQTKVSQLPSEEK